MGRPTADDPREHTVCFRATKSEKDEINRLVGSRNRSELLRNLVLEALRHEDATA